MAQLAPKIAINKTTANRAIVSPLVRLLCISYWLRPTSGRKKSPGNERGGATSSVIVEARGAYAGGTGERLILGAVHRRRCSGKI